MGNSAAQFDSLLARYLESIDVGVPIDRQQFIRQHPEFRTELERYFENVSLLEELADETVSPGGPTTWTPQSSSDAGSDCGDNDLPPDFGPYRIESHLGRGAMGLVYLAHDTQLDRQVALKFPRRRLVDSDEMVRRFRREARAAARIRHANVCPIYEFGEVHGRCFLAMAYVDGVPLNELAHCAQRPSQRHAALIVHKLALGLAEAHRLGVVHRDLKASNVMIDQAGEPVVMDFGLSCQLPDGDGQITQEGVVLGTPAYMAPEQLEGRAGPAADIYALGVILYELLTGRTPFSGSATELMKQIVLEPPRPPSKLCPNLDSRLEAVCLKMLSKREDDRYDSMDAVATALAAAVGDSVPASSTRRGFIALAGLTAALGSVSWFLLRTPRGALRVVVHDAGIEARVSGQSGWLTTREATSLQVLPTGEHRLEVRRDGRRLVTPAFQLGPQRAVELRVELVNDFLEVRDDRGRLLARSDKAWRERPQPGGAVELALARGAVLQGQDEHGVMTGPLGADEAALSDWLAVTFGSEASFDDDVAVALAGDRRIRRVDIRASVSADRLQRISEMSWLEGLHFRAVSGLKAEHFAALAGQEQLRELTVLEAPSPAHEDFWDEALSTVGKMRQLQTLHVGGFSVRISDRGLASLHQLKKLEQLGVQSNNFTDKGLSALLPQLPNLRHLHVTSRAKEVTGAFLQAGRPLPAIEVLSLSCSRLQDEWLVAALRLPQLAELYIVDAESVSGHAIAKVDVLPSLDYLALQSTGLDDDGLEQIGRVASLTRLSIRANPKITDRGLQGLVNLRQLIRLECSDNPQLSDGLVDLCVQLPCLVAVHSVNTGVTPNGREQLRRSLPKAVLTPD